jgi:DNA transformation protein
MSLAAADIAFAVDLFAELGNITTRKMMGGLCIYADGRLFAILDANGAIYLKAQGAFADKLRAAGARPFVYGRKDGTSHTMAYWTLPDAALDDPAAACEWAREALDHLT